MKADCMPFSNFVNGNIVPYVNWARWRFPTNEMSVLLLLTILQLWLLKFQ